MSSAFRDHLIYGQPESARFKYAMNTEGREVLTSPNGWWLSWHRDSDCVEVQTKPMTIEQFKHYKDDLQDAIFVTAANAGYFPALWQGGGHINIDITNFQNDPLLFRNFIVDLLNHNELFMGVLEFNIHRAGRPHEFESNIQRAVDMIDLAMRNKTVTFEKVREEFAKVLTGNSFSLQKIKEERRIEIRAVRPQTSMDTWIRQIELFEGRIQYLSTIREPIPYQPRVPWNYDRLAPPAERSIPPIDPQEAFKSFYIYITESGLRWQDHTDYLWPMWKSSGEVQKFEQSDWFKQQEASSGCAIQLQDQQSSRK